MLKYMMIAAGIVALAGIAWPVATGAFSGGPNEATRLVEATERTNNKAGNLNESFTDIIPPAPPGIPDGYYAQPGRSTINSPGNSPLAARADIPHNRGRSPRSDRTRTDGRPVHPVRTPQRARRAGRHGVPPPASDRGGTQTDRVHPGSRTAPAAWAPRYNRAVEEYKRFAYRIDQADAMARGVL